MTIKRWNGSSWSPSGGVTDHGDLDGKGDDDHAQYARTDGTRRVATRIVTPTFGGTTTVDVGTTDIARFTATSAFTLAVTGTPVDGQEIDVEVTQNGTGGWALTHSASFQGSTTTPLVGTLDIAANKLTLLKYRYNTPLTKWLLIAINKGY